MKNPFKVLPVLLVLICATAVAPGARAEEPSEVVAGVGLLDVFRDGKNTRWMGSVDYRFGKRLFGLRPWAGLSGAEQGTVFASAGVLYTHETKHGLRLTAAFAPTLYDANSGRDLGSTFEFYSFGEASHVFRNRHMLGLRIGHLSNGGLARRNPGSENLMITYSVPLNAGH